ncbi:hypothetical protein [Paractinoplanes hotanensis]|uniref:Uncharacterized protein n=1 Tax=Paractinoplanes hotanensis TaxID=2906497 RepID=A0ABT0YFT3_9ACTN|nr:hypothetical protein [Actinoplanes hotanensis]MCM4084937.1 hypothetical protein [Actinoplanes hotanensis]
MTRRVDEQPHGRWVAAASTGELVSEPDENQSLSEISGFAFPVSCTTGGEMRARALARRMERAVSWLDDQGVVPFVPALFVVGSGDWAGVTLGPPYGMPHGGDGRIVVGREAGPFWQELLVIAASHPDAEMEQRLAAAYGRPADVEPFADLLIVHQLGHLTHSEGWSRSPISSWLGEIAANLCLHGYVSEAEPESLPVLETLCEAVWEAAQGPWPVRDLDRMADALAGDGANYFWFRFGLQILARRLWESAGPTALRGVVSLLQSPVQPLGDVADVLATFDLNVGRAVLDWPHFGSDAMRNNTWTRSACDGKESVIS